MDPRRTPLAATVILALLPALAPADPPPPVPAGDLTDATRAAVRAAIAKVYPTLVQIHVVTTMYYDGREVKHEASGSGAIISAEGHVITNHHVAGKARRIRCTLSSKVELDATLVGTDPLADVAVVKLDLAGARAVVLPVAGFGDSDKLQVGDRVLAMGCPLALSQSVTMGIVSNRELMLGRFQGEFRNDGEEVGTLVKWIGHDAQIFPGNSGGPLVNLQGEIIGINDIGVGLGGAIPGNLAREVAEQLIKTGEVKRSWIGLSVQPLLKGGTEDRGVLVGGVLPGSPAEKAGLKPGDILLSYAGKAFTIKYREQLPEFNHTVLSQPSGTAVPVVYRRDGKEHQTTVTPINRGPAEDKQRELKAWGLTGQDLSLLMATGLRRAPQSGVLVTSVRTGGPAAEAKPGLQYGDVIVEVAGKPVRNLADLDAATTSAVGAATDPVPVLVAFDRHKERLLTVVRVGEKETEDRSANVTKAWLGVSYQILTPDLAEALGLKGKAGVRLTEVYPDQPAAKAGLKVGDVLVSLDEEALDLKREEDSAAFEALVRRRKVNATVPVEYLRDGKLAKAEIKLGRSPRSEREVAEYENTRLEFKARDLMFRDRVQRQLPPDQAGVIVTAVESGGWAALANLHVGDVILAIDGQSIQSLNDLRDRLKEAEQKKPARLVFFLRRGVQTMYAELEPIWPSK